jgi:hypothetical protein
MTGKLKGQDLGLVEGILGLTDASNATADMTATNITTLVDVNGDVVGGGDTVLTMFDELFTLYDQYVSSELTPDVCLVPRYQYKALAQVRDSFGGKPWDAIREAYPATTFMVVDEANDAGGAGIDRFAVYSRDAEVQTVVIPEEYHELEAYQLPIQTIVIPNVMQAGGVISNFPTGVCYLDMDRTNGPA